MATSLKSSSPAETLLTPATVVITDCDLAGEGIEASELEGVASVLDGHCATPAELVEACRDADGILVQWLKLGDAEFGQLPRLRAVVRYGIGVDNLDLEAARARGIDVRNVPDYCIDEVAEHTTALVMAGARRLLAFNAQVRAGNWTVRNTPAPLPFRSDPVGLVGFGRIARAVAQRLVALGFPVQAWDPYATVDMEGVDAVRELRDLASSVNHLSVHAPLTPQTAGMIDREIIRALGSKGHLVNTSRGGLIAEDDLLQALDDGALGWASLDVFTSEPPTDTARRLAEHPRVLATPHAAYLSTDSPARLRQRAAQIMRAALTNEDPI